jgi:hypothetical protein
MMVMYRALTYQRPAAVTLPKGDPEIARQFTAGSDFTVEFVPEGRLTISSNPQNCILRSAP